MTRHLSTQPVQDDDEAIAEALAEVSVPALIASVVQITGDPSYVRGPIAPHRWVHNEFQGALTEPEKAELRRDALKAIAAWRDEGCPPTAPPTVELQQEIMDWIACDRVPDEYIPMYVEEMDLQGRNPRAITLATSPPIAADFSVIVIGCGQAGLMAGIRMKEAGIAFEILDKNDDVGGTWLENTYPGCRVDVASHYYCYSFEPNTSFTEYYSQQPELHRNFQALMAEHGVAEHVRWRSEVESAVWDEHTARWQVTVRKADGSIEIRSANALISGVGILNRPHIPDLPNLHRFHGPVFHSAQWDHSVDLRGKRVALIGAGASGFQIGPAIAEDVDQLVVFQRTPQWMSPNPRYHDAVSPGEQWAMRHLPGYARWYRFMLMWQSSDQLLEMVRIDPQWPDLPRTANAWSAARRDVFQSWIEDQVGDDPDLLAKVIPDYPPMAKRMLQDNGSWLRCLKQPNVELVTDEILDIDEHGITTVSGRHSVDVIVLATGFRASEVLWPMNIVGRGGASIADTWDGKPSAYLGTSVPGFPNFFIMAGPGTGLAHAGSVIQMTECQMRYIGNALRALIDSDRRSIEPTPAAHECYAQALQAEIATLMWGHPSIKHSWYKSDDGNVYVLCPWRSVDYWSLTADLNHDEHILQ